MDREEIEETLECLAYMEQENLTNNFERICPLVREYKERYGQTEFMTNFTTEYLEQRQRYYCRH